MTTARDALTPDALALLQAVAQAGSFAAAARELGLVPSAVTYRIRQIEDALDVLLFDRSSRQARLTAGRHRTAARRRPPAGGDRRRRQPGQAGCHRLGIAAHDRGGHRDLRFRRHGTGAGLLRAGAGHPAATARRVALGDAGGADLGPGRSGRWASRWSPAPRRASRAACWARSRSSTSWRRTIRWRPRPEPLADDLLQQAPRHRGGRFGAARRRHHAGAAGGAGCPDGADHARQARCAAARPGRRLRARADGASLCGKRTPGRQGGPAQRAAGAPQLCVAQPAPTRGAPCNGGWRSWKAPRRAAR